MITKRSICVLTVIVALTLGFQPAAKAVTPRNVLILAGAIMAATLTVSTSLYYACMQFGK